MGRFDRIFARKEDSFELTDPYQYEKEDCTSCRIIGSTAFVTLGGWTYFSGMKQLRQQQNLIEASKSKYKYGSRQLGILTLSATFLGLGIYRMIN